VCWKADVNFLLPKVIPQNASKSDKLYWPFCLSNISYEQLGRHRPSLLINKGLMNLVPGMAIWWFLLGACNMAAPPLNLLGEVGLLSGLVSLFWLLMFVLVLLSFF
jgi:hypothetical protein